ncbi:DEAD/DEAH box helicase [Gordonia iterans]|uniref:DEAD/DEAH box helicase n=1 Tax=Gordonia iterans TaxID=1004901 RepID=A0A2S0KGL7_9ACTN|nr:DEAD/DEAH box helicase [Gordonia iterans]AVM00781.1 DEAD/DEAH box helicase [Gordonia iterans]
MSTESELQRFTGTLAFPLDPFQRDACEVLADGGAGNEVSGPSDSGAGNEVSGPSGSGAGNEVSGPSDSGAGNVVSGPHDSGAVLVCAPTGAGKTVVGEFAVFLALARGGKCFYTTPIKALSNQKYHDLVAAHGAANVGLLTGDNSINSSAPVVVMTTEVLRNMIYAESSALTGLSFVVMDEVHFLADRFRGAVWEEVILGLDPSVSVVSLSATVSNAEEFGDWITTVRGDTEVIVDEHRPVPLHQHMLVGNRMFELFDPRASGPGKKPVNPELMRYIKHRALGVDEPSGARGPRGRTDRRRRSSGVPRPRLIRLLDEHGMLPAIDFIFSRKGCEDAFTQCLRSDLNLLDGQEVARVDAIVERHLAELSPGDAAVLGVDDWRAGLRRGFAAHHAGLLPLFRHAVEELFVEGLIKVVFATETLAMGINMPARSVVLERLVKYNGEAHVDLTPGEYTQLTGRAGRRGLDVEGNAVVVWTPEVLPERVAGLAGARTFPLRSSFTPEYNMVLNLIDRLGVDGSRDLLRRSFAQFQTDRTLVGQARQLDRARRKLRDADRELIAAAEKLGIDPGISLDQVPGDRNAYEGFLGYLQLREDIRTLEREARFVRRQQSETAVTDDLAALKRGQVIAVGSRRHRGLAVVLEAAQYWNDPRPLVLVDDGWTGRVGAEDFVNPPEVLGNLRIRKDVDTRTGKGRRRLAEALRASGIARPIGRTRKHRNDDGPDTELTRLRELLRAHPAHPTGGSGGRRKQGAEQLFRMGENRNRLVREVESLERSISERKSKLEVDFDVVTEVLRELAYLEPDAAGGLRVTPTGDVLRRIYCETDLLVAECIRAGIWDHLAPPELAAVVSAMVYQSRRDFGGGVDTMPGDKRVRDALTETVAVWQALVAVQAQHAGGSEALLTREPDTGFCAPISVWAAGRSLEEALTAASAGGQTLSPGDFVRWNRQVIDLLEQIRNGVDPEAPLAGAARRAAKSLRRGVVAADLE